MSKIAIIYWSGTGNTLAMAEEIKKTLDDKGVETSLIQASDFDKSQIEEFNGFAFGCPAMGSEELEDSEFEPMFESVETSLGDKPTAIFGSYEWAEGEWMETWQARCEDNSINLVADGLIAYDNPDDEALEACRKLAEKLYDSVN